LKNKDFVEKTDSGVRSLKSYLFPFPLKGAFDMKPSPSVIMPKIRSQFQRFFPPPPAWGANQFSGDFFFEMRENE